MIRKQFFDSYGGENVFLYVLGSDRAEVGITDFGASIQYFRIKTAEGVKDVVLGYPSVKERLDSGTYCGSVVGRVANRIKNSEFVLNGKTFKVSANDSVNCNHGGMEGFDKRMFNVTVDGDALELELSSPDGDQGFPGNLKLKARFELNGLSLGVRFSAECDKDTPWSPTLHPYFNLNGEGGGTDGGVNLKINSCYITPVDGENVVTGELKPVAGTAFDFSSYRPLGDAIALTGGYDINYVLDGGHAASAYCKKSGIGLDIYTDMPALQFYTGNFLNGRGKSGEYRPHYGFCLEPQFVPNAVNIDKFRSPFLKAHTKREHFIRYDFSVSDV